MSESANASATQGHHGHGEGETRRDFLALAATAFAGAGAACALWPFIDSMNPAADTLALSTTDVDLTPIQEGQRVTAKWRGKVVFIEHRSQKQIEEARAVDIGSLPDPARDQDRVQKDEWLVIIGVCTHLGCIPNGQKQGEPRGDFGGWFCPCHGSHYDSSGRIRRGPAPRNLDVPPYTFTTDTSVRLG